MNKTILKFLDTLTVNINPNDLLVDIHEIYKLFFKMMLPTILLSLFSYLIYLSPYDITFYLVTFLTLFWWVKSYSQLSKQIKKLNNILKTTFKVKTSFYISFFYFTVKNISSIDGVDMISQYLLYIMNKLNFSENYEICSKSQSVYVILSYNTYILINFSYFNHKETVCIVKLIESHFIKQSHYKSMEDFDYFITAIYRQEKYLYNKNIKNKLENFS